MWISSHNNKEDITLFCTSSVEYGFELQLLLKRESDRMDKTWFHILKLNQSLPRSAPSLAILGTFRYPVMTYRNIKLDVVYSTRLQIIGATA